MEIKIKVLKKGDSVINVFPYNESVAIVVKRKAGGTDIIVLEKNSEKIPRIGDIWQICDGDNEVEVSDPKSSVKITTF
jgi:hypothetical protein